MEFGLNQFENEEVYKVSNLLNLDTHTRQLSISYLTEYKKKTKIEYLEKLLPFINCAIFTASKSRTLTNIKGETIRGIGVSVNQLIRASFGENFNSEQDSEIFLECLKEFINNIELKIEILNEIQNIIERYSFSNIFYYKYINFLKSLDLQQKFGCIDYMNTLKNMTWLIFICAKKYILQNRRDFMESTYLLIATLFQLLNLTQESITIGYYIKSINNHNCNTDSQRESMIQEILIHLFNLQLNHDEIQNYKKSLNEFLKRLIDDQILVVNDDISFNGLYNIQNIFINNKKLEQYYLMNLCYDEPDERFYIRNLKIDDIKIFTPYIRQNGFNRNILIKNDFSKNNPLQQKKTYTSYKILNYDALDSQKLSIHANKIKILDKPQNANEKDIQDVPMTKLLEIHIWLIQITTIEHTLSGLPPLLDKCCSDIGEDFKETIKFRVAKLAEQILATEYNEPNILACLASQDKLKAKYDQIISLYFKMMNEYLIAESKKNRNISEILTNDTLNKSIIACSCKVVLFVHNSTNITFKKLLEICQIDCIDFWNVISYFTSLDPQPPFNIKKHLYEIEKKILNSLAWKKNSIIDKLIENIQNQIDNNILDKISESFDSKCTIQNEKISEHDEINDTKSPDNSYQIPMEFNNYSQESTMEKNSNSQEDQAQITKLQENQVKPRKICISLLQEAFFKRLINQTAFEVYQCCEQLRLPEKIQENIWIVMKYIISTKIQILIERDIMQMILCTIFCICKIYHHPYKFQEIISKYAEIPNMNKDEVKELTNNVYINENERADLVKLYNAVYLAHIKNFILLINDEKVNIKANGYTFTQENILIPVIAPYLQFSLKESLPEIIQAHKSKTKKNSLINKASWTSELFSGLSTPMNTSIYNHSDSQKELNQEDMRSSTTTNLSVMDMFNSKKIGYNAIEMSKSDVINLPGNIGQQDVCNSAKVKVSRIFFNNDGLSTGPSSLGSSIASFQGAGDINQGYLKMNDAKGMMKFMPKKTLMKEIVGPKKINFDELDNFDNEDQMNMSIKLGKSSNINEIYGKNNENSVKIPISFSKSENISSTPKFKN